jgi:hypothetical protein
MRDPWESDPPAQETQPELTQTKVESEDLPDAPKPPAVKLKQQSLAREKKEWGVTNRKQSQPEKITIAPQIATDSTTIASLLQLDRKNLIQGVLWAEVLGKPKSKRGRREYSVFKPIILFVIINAKTHVIFRHRFWHLFAAGIFL